MSDAKLVHIPGERADPTPDVAFDIVFVHGLGGDLYDTWTHENGAFWPKWLATRFGATNVYTAGYDSGIFTSFLNGDGASLADRATTLLDRLASRPSSGRPLVFITHSLGGLVVKQLLRKADGAAKARYRSIGENTLGVIFIATPHQGATAASAACAIIKLLTSQSLKQLQHGNELLLDLGGWFSNWAGKKLLAIDAYYEVNKCNGVLVVDKMTAHPHVNGCDPVAVQADHISITKLEDDSSQLFQSICKSIEELLDSHPPLPPANDGEELAVFQQHADDDRRTLAMKLAAVKRDSDIPHAERQKERFSQALHRHIAQPSAIHLYTKLLSNIDSRFRRHVKPLIEAGADQGMVNSTLQEKVLDPSLKSFDQDTGNATAGTVDGAYYWLAGNCHIGWDK